jgi:DNA-directed RNA polymerase specialized sigma24 family protein
MNRFATTNWSAILKAARYDGENSVEALADLCKHYWYPLYAFSRTLGDDHSDAQDLTQAFFQHLIERRAIASIDPTQGRFRSFVIACFKNFRSAQLRKMRTSKRGGKYSIMSYEELSADERFSSEPIEAETPEGWFDRNWALAVLDQAHARLKREYATGGKQDLFERLHASIQGSDRSLNYETAAADLKKTKDAVKMEASRMRRRFGELLREVVNETVADVNEVEDELRYLLRLLSA